MKPNFFEIFFQRKCSLGSCATFSENMVSVSVLGFEKFASQVLKSKARAPKTSPYGHLAKLVPQKRLKKEPILTLKWTQVLEVK